MSKIKTTFYCQVCGNESAKWQGKCNACNSWNTIVEEVINKHDKKDVWNNDVKKNVAQAIPLDEVVYTENIRCITQDLELNNVLGGGIVAGSVTLVAGEPGIGKSTLFLQVFLEMQSITTLYVSGEESAQQIKVRADRLQLKNENLYILNSTDTQTIFNEVKKIKPHILVIDSIQTLQSAYIDSVAGSISQIKECTAEIVRYAKESGTPVFIIGHITKDGSIAGPKILEHMVDTVLQFEGDLHHTYRILRATKNRFGNVHEMGIYEMIDKGLRQVNNPSEVLITQKEESLSGIAIAVVIEGVRPMLIEVQALVTQSVYGTPQRTTSGFDLRRLQLLLAVLEKRGGFIFGNKDVFLNIAGGIRIEDPAVDLAVIAALLSSYEDTPIAQRVCFAAEVGLSGEVRSVYKIEQRIAETEKMGFEKIFISKYNSGNTDKNINIEIVGISKVEEMYRLLF